MARWLVVGVIGIVATLGAQTSPEAQVPGSLKLPAGAIAPAETAAIDLEEPPGRPDDPPADTLPPERPSTVLDDFRAPVLPELRQTNRSTRSAANRIVGTVLAAGGTGVVRDATLAAIGAISDRSVARSDGPDRYETAVSLSTRQFPTGASDVWLATGENFPDGLAASAVAGAHSGPVLLTRSGALPASVRAELERLAPKTIWLVGGTSAVSESVRADVAATLPSAVIERRAGVDRYGTAAALAADFADAGAVFVATGNDFPDALSAGPAAARAAAPTLLVQRNDLPPATEEQLRKLRPKVVYVVGGSSVISDRVVTHIAAATGSAVERIAGANRYETAAAVAERFFEATTPSLVLATGADFPDSIAAGAVAGVLNSPLLLVDSQDIPPRITVDAARALSWWLPESGRVLRYVVVAHPDDEFSSWSLIGDRNPLRYDVVITLTTGESTGYCTGLPVTNPWSSQQYLPEPQPTGVQYSDRCKKHRRDSWRVFIENSGFGPIGVPEQRTGSTAELNGRELSLPLRRDATGATVSATDYTLAVGADSAVIAFDLGALTSDEVLWAIQTTRGLIDRFPTQVEGDVIGAGYFNDSPGGYENLHEDHRAVHELLRDTDLGMRGSQYAPVGHGHPTRVFGASVTDYCGAMCHPGSGNAFRGSMGRFQHAYGWLAAGYWLPGRVDAHAGFSEYQSFAKWF